MYIYIFLKSFLKTIYIFFKSILKNDKRPQWYLSNLWNLERADKIKYLRILSLLCYIHQKIRTFINVLSSGINALRVALRKKCPYSDTLQENTDQKNSKYGHFLRSVAHIKCWIPSLKLVPSMCNVPKLPEHLKNLKTFVQDF